MVAQYKFLFVRHYKNNHGQITIPRGTAGILSFEDCKVHLQCFRIIPQQGTSHLTVKFEYIKDCVILKDIENEEPDESLCRNLHFRRFRLGTFGRDGNLSDS